MSKPCSSNGGLGCARGFVREKCSKCSQGSIACDMCQTGTSIHNGRFAPSLNRSKFSSSKASTTDVALNRTSPSRTASITYQFPLPLSRPKQLLRGSSQPTPTSPMSISLNTNAPLAKRISVSAPSSPTIATRPLLPIIPETQGSSSQSCIFCFNGRKACIECFGLGYVQRICQECIRNQYRRNSRKASLPISLNQLGTKIKEQFFNPISTSFSESTLPLPCDNSSTSDIPSPSLINFDKSKKAQKPPRLQLRSKSMISLPMTAALESPISSSIMRPLVKVMEDNVEGAVSCSMDTGRNHVDHSIDNTNSNESSNNIENINGTKKKSIKAMIRSAFKLPTLFQNNRHAVDNRSEQGHMRQWTLRSISMVNLSTAPTVA